MARRQPSVEEVIRLAVERVERGELEESILPQVERWLERGRECSCALVVELLDQQGRLAEAKARCGKALEASAGMKRLLVELAEGSASPFRLVRLVQREDGPRAVCRAGGTLRWFPIHPSVDPAELERLRSFEYVLVRDDIVVGVWSGDPELYEAALGDVAQFCGFFDRDRGLVRIRREGRSETIARLASTVDREALVLDDSLVLQRDDAGTSIARIDAAPTECRFEVPLANLDGSLDDLGGLDSLVEELQEEFVLRVARPDIGERFGLGRMYGFLLMSEMPGTGKTALVRGYTRWAAELGERAGFDVRLYVVKPNETKSLWHGEDSRLVREELFGRMRAQQREPRDRPLVQILYLDEIDSLGRRGASGTERSGAQTDSLETFLVELDGVENAAPPGPPVCLVVIGATNRLDRVDFALRRYRRFGDRVKHMPRLDRAAAEEIAAVHARGREMPWLIDGTPAAGRDLSEVRARILRPAIAQIFDATVLTYTTDNRRTVRVEAGRLLAGAHYEQALQRARAQAARRELYEVGAPAVTFEDVAGALAEVAVETAQQMKSDPATMVRLLEVTSSIVDIDVVSPEQLSLHEFVHAHPA